LPLETIRNNNEIDLVQNGEPKYENKTYYILASIVEEGEILTNKLIELFDDENAEFDYDIDTEVVKRVANSSNTQRVYEFKYDQGTVGIGNNEADFFNFCVQNQYLYRDSTKVTTINNGFEIPAKAIRYNKINDTTTTYDATKSYSYEMTEDVFVDYNYIDNETWQQDLQSGLIYENITTYVS